MSAKAIGAHPALEALAQRVGWTGCLGCGEAAEDVADGMLVEEFGCPVGLELGLCQGVDEGCRDCEALVPVVAAAWAAALRAGVPKVWVPLAAGVPGSGLSVQVTRRERELLGARAEVLGVARVCLSMAEAFPQFRAAQLHDARVELARAVALRGESERLRGEALADGSSVGEVSMVLEELSGVRPVALCQSCVRSGDGAAANGCLSVDWVEGRALSWLRVPTLRPGRLVLGPVPVC